MKKVLAALAIALSNLVGLGAQNALADPGNSCNWNNIPYTWRWCAPSSGNYYTQAWIGQLETDGNGNYHYNVHYQPSTGGSDIHNWHVYYCGEGGSQYYWAWVDSNTGNTTMVGESVYPSLDQASNYAAQTLANEIQGAIQDNQGQPVLGVDLMEQDSYGDPNDLPISFKTLAGKPATGNSPCGPV